MYELYVEHYIAELNVMIAVEDLRGLLNEQEVLFNRTQPSSPVIDSEKVDGGKKDNSIEEYLVKKDQKKLEDRIEIAKKILIERKELVEHYVGALKASHDIKNQIYYLKYIKGMKPKEISWKVNYSEVHVYRIINNIKRRLNKIGVM